MKRLWCILLVTLLVASIVPSGFAEAADGPLTPFEETVHMVIGANVSATTTGPDGGTLDSNPVKDYMQKQLNIEYEYGLEAMNGANFADQLSLAIAAGEIPDAIMVGYNDFVSLYEAGLLADLTDVFEEYASDDLKALYNSFSYDIYELPTQNGRLMAIPRCCAEPECYVWVRQDWVDKLGLEIDTDGDRLLTLDEIEMIASEFIANDPDETGEPVGIVSSTSFLGINVDISLVPFMSSFGVYNHRWMRDEDGTVYYGGITDRSKEALEWARNLYEKGLLDEQFGVRTKAESLVVEGRCGLFVGEMNNPTWCTTSLFEEHPEAYLVAYGVDNGEGKMNTPLYNMVNRFVVVSAEYEHPEAVVKFINLIWDMKNDPTLPEKAPEVYAYVMADPVSVFLDPFRLESYAADNFLQRYMVARDYLAGNITRDQVPASLLAAMDNVDKYNNGTASPIETADYFWTMEGSRLGVELNEAGRMNYVAPVYTRTKTMELRESDLRSLELEAWTQIITGEQPLDYYDTYVEEWMRLGGEDILKELNEAVNG